MEEQQTYQQPMQEQPKKSKAWIWILIILILAGLGVLIYLLFFAGGECANGICSMFPGVDIGSSIPQPPTLPD